MNVHVGRKRLMMMKILRESGSPLSSHRIQEQLNSRGMDISERTVRFHLQALDSLGFTDYKEKKGRFLTPQGWKELAKAHVYDRIGFLSAKIDDMTYRMNFDPKSGTGTVLVNLSLLRKGDPEGIGRLLSPVFAEGLAHGKLVALFDEQERVGDFVIPDGHAGLATVCSITLNGALIQAGIPVTSVFGGLLEIHDGVPDRFTNVIRYSGTSLDPLEIYITSRMTSTNEAAADGSGLVGASFREIPAAAREKAMETAACMEQWGLGGYLKLGYPGHSLLDIPVGEGRTGLIVTGGLNAVAPLVEAGISIESHSLSALVDYSRLFSYRELDSRLADITRDA